MKFTLNPLNIYGVKSWSLKRFEHSLLNLATQQSSSK